MSFVRKNTQVEEFKKAIHDIYDDAFAAHENHKTSLRDSIGRTSGRILSNIMNSSLTAEEKFECLAFQIEKEDYSQQYVGYNLGMFLSNFGNDNGVYYFDSVSSLIGTVAPQQVLVLLKQISWNGSLVGDVTAKGNDKAISAYFNLIKRLYKSGISAEDALDLLLMRSKSTHVPTALMESADLDVFLDYLKFVNELTRNTKLPINLKVRLGEDSFFSGLNVLAKREGSEKVIYYMLENDMVYSLGYKKLALAKEKVFDHVLKLPEEQKITALLNTCTATPTEPHPLHKYITTPRYFSKCTPEKGSWKKMNDALETALYEQRKEARNVREAIQQVEEFEKKQSVDSQPIQPIMQQVRTETLLPIQYQYSAQLQYEQQNRNSVQQSRAYYEPPQQYPEYSLDTSYLQLGSAPFQSITAEKMPQPPLNAPPMQQAPNFSHITLPPAYNEATNVKTQSIVQLASPPSYEESVLNTPANIANTTLSTENNSQVVKSEESLISLDFSEVKVVEKKQIVNSSIVKNSINELLSLSLPVPAEKEKTVEKEKIIEKEPQIEISENNIDEISFPAVPTTNPILSNNYNTSSMYNTNKSNVATKAVVEEKQQKKLATLA